MPDQENEARFVVRVEVDQAKRDLEGLKQGFRDTAKEARGPSFGGSVIDAFQSPIQQMAGSLIGQGVNAAYGSVIPGGVAGAGAFAQEGFAALGRTETGSGNEKLGAVLGGLSDLIAAGREFLGMAQARDAAREKAIGIAGDVGASGFGLSGEQTQQLFEVFRAQEEGRHRAETDAANAIARHAIQAGG